MTVRSDISMIIKRLIYFVALLSAMVACNRIEDNSILYAPSDLKAEQIGLESIRLTWTNDSKSYDGVIVERASQEGGWEFSEIGRAPEGNLYFDDNRHSGEAFYQYRLTTYRRDKTSASAYVTYRYSKLPAPADFKGELTDEGYVLTWTDNCAGEDGYVVLRGRDDEVLAEWKVLGADVETVTDTEIVSGIYNYEVYAYAGEFRSGSAALKFENTSVPQIKTGNVTASWHQVHVQFHVLDDGGFSCEAGICWRTDGGKGANTNDNSYTYPSRLRTGDPFFGVAQNLDPGKAYYFRPWVKYGDKYQYFTEVRSSLMEEPAGLTPVWTDMSRQYKVHSSVKLYRTETEISGRNVKAWYALADMSAGDIELRTFMTPAATRPSDAAKELDGVQIMVNGGYFSGNESYSYVMDHGVEAAPGIRSVAASYYADSELHMVSRNYNVTRGAFGVNSDQKPSLKWIYTSCDWAYEVPMPVFNSGPVTQPTSTYPSYKQKWDVHSAIGGGPVILHDDHLCIDYLTTKDKGDAKRYVGNPEMIGDEVFGPTVRIARTAIGHTADGKIVIMVVDGTNGSAGVSLDELARLMKGVGCTDVLNLDGGDSSVMCATQEGVVLNYPSGGAERQVVSFVALVAR